MHEQWKVVKLITCHECQEMYVFLAVDSPHVLPAVLVSVRLPCSHYSRGLVNVSEWRYVIVGLQKLLESLLVISVVTEIGVLNEQETV